MNPTLHYLIKETALRWRTRPSSPLARAVLTFTLAATAGGFLVGFSASAKALRLQLARFGFETLAIRIIGAENATSPTTAISPDHWAAPLAPDGQVIILQQAPILPTTPWGHTATVFVTPWPVLAGLSRSVQSPPAILLTNDWPAGKTMPFTLRDGTEISAVALPAEGPWKTLIEGDALLIPPEFVPAPPPKGAVEVVLFTPKNPENLESWVTAIKRHFAAENRPLPVLQDPSPLRKALAELERGQSLWRRAILGLLGTGVILIFTAIGILEQQEMRFAQALLRSLGIPRRVLWLANLVENLLLANLALTGALLAVDWGAGRILAHLPAFGSATDVGVDLQSFYFLALVVNIGVLNSLFPLRKALLKPIGTLLS